MAGGPSTPELAAAVSEAGGLGSLAAGYLSADALAQRIDRLRGLTERPFAVNLFVPGEGPSDPARYGRYLEHLRGWAERAGLELGEPRYTDDDWEAKLGLLVEQPVAVVSFTFGCPPAEVVERLHRAGSEVWVTVTAPDEGAQAQAAGADVLVAQGAEAGGHRGTFNDREDAPAYGLLALLALLQASVSSPLVAAGGIATGAGIAAALTAGARAAQLGTAFLLCPEAGTSPAQRRAVATREVTVLTRAFTGRQARGIRNEFIRLHDGQAEIGYPELHYVTAPLRRAARERDDPELINLWAGETHELARAEPASAVVARLAIETREALAEVQNRLG